MIQTRQRSSRGRNFGGRDIRHGTSRSTKYYSRQNSDRSDRGRMTPRGSGRREEPEARDAWN